MLPHPAEYLARFYLSKGHSNSDVVSLLTAQDLPGMTEDDAEHIRDTLEIPSVPKLNPDSKTKAFLRRIGVWDMWKPTKHMKLAKAVLDNARLRETVETLVLSPMKSHHIAKIVEGKFGVTLTPRAVELFEHYYWNKGLLTGVQWGEFLAARAENRESIQKLAVEVRGEGGIHLILHKLGLSGFKKLEAAKMFGEARDQSFMFLQELALQNPSSKHAKAWLDYLKAARLAQVALDDVENETEDVLVAFKSFKLKTKSGSVESLDELTKGNYTQPEVVEDDDSDDFFDS